MLLTLKQIGYCSFHQNPELRKEVDLHNSSLNQSKHIIFFEKFIYILFMSKFRQHFSSVSALLTVTYYVLDEARRINVTKNIAVIMFLTTVAGKGNRNLRLLLWKVCCSLCKPYKLQGISQQQFNIVLHMHSTITYTDFQIDGMNSYS